MDLEESQSETGSTSASSYNSWVGFSDRLSIRDNDHVVVTLKSGAARALMGLKLMDKNNVGWSEVALRFDRLAGPNGAIPRSTFAQCIGMNELSEFAGEMFDALAKRRGITSFSVSRSELREFWEQITDQSFDARLQIFFDMVDKHADNLITEEEVKEIISLSAGASKLSNIEEFAEEYAALIMEELDPANLRYIELYNLEELLLQGPDQSRIRSQKVVPTKEFNLLTRFYKQISYFVQDNWRRIWIVVLWFAICAGVFAWKFIQYRNRAVFEVMGYCTTTAKGAAETLKFNMALILLPVCRNTMTWLRSKTKLGLVVPFDDNINFHKVIAVGIIVGVGLHAGSFITCIWPRILRAAGKEYERMKPFFGEEEPNNYGSFVKGTEGWTGVVMVLLMAISFILAQPWFRRSKLNLPKALNRLSGFNAFWYSHHLFIVVYVLFVVHGYCLYLPKKWYKKTTWMYLAVPVILYACERLIRTFRSGYKTVEILKGVIYPGNVLSLHMSKPQGFKYTSGQYIYLNCAAISPFQWHPFSITSAPGDDFLSVHIRALGDWTSQLKFIFAKVCEPPSSNQSGLLRADFGSSIDRHSKMPRLLVDGPYGAPAQDYKQYEVLLLVGLGIGATPLISILKDVLNNIKQRQEKEDHMKKKLFAPTRAYFYWVAREQGSFEWFRGVMSEVANQDVNGVIELHNYITSIYVEEDTRSALISMLWTQNHAKKDVDIVSGTRVNTHFGRPDWSDIFKHVAVQHSDKRVGVFYCGAHVLVEELKKMSQDYSRKTSTKFDFHKENF